MNRRMRHVLPTAPSPTRQILTFIFGGAISNPQQVQSRARASGYKGVVQRLSSGITAARRRLNGGGTQVSPRRPIASARALNASFTPAPVFAEARNWGAP